MLSASGEQIDPLHYWQNVNPHRRKLVNNDFAGTVSALVVDILHQALPPTFTTFVHQLTTAFHGWEMVTVCLILQTR